ncbi:hybrid sensor histidine kinase/response regulator transcription factor [Olivibacter sp. XZL3]|uniref:hybrid sensor histidine kinase/response regulator transcription factor n=1 Tax=Olivibacter sp. XZL3 TaxID=1735116 RepID=UPI00106607BB|nr:hybrid sensor histidine kinase/response regulator transcription factor [Olivibacter sp. XZL3]
MMRNAYLLCAFLWLFFFNRTVGLSRADELRFKHLTFNEGLVQSPVTAMLQDHRGFVWIGNWKGLIRYDGYEFKEFSYRKGKQGGISNGRVNAIFEDKTGFLWIGTANGLNRYNPQTESFEYFGSSQLKGGKNYISGITQDWEGTIWVSTFAGLFPVDIAHCRLAEEPLFAGTVYTLFLDAVSDLWIGTKTGVRCFNPYRRRKLELPTLLKNDIKLNQSKILFIRQDQDSGYWFGTEEDGLIYYKPEAESLITFTEQNSALASNMIKDMVFDHEHRLWIGTRGGISVYNPRLHTFTAYRHVADNPFSIYDNSVWSLMIDRDHHIWVGTFSGAISYATPNNTNFSNIGGDGAKRMEFQNRIAHALVPDGIQALWVGTFGGGLHHLDYKHNRIAHYAIPSNDRVLASQHIKSMALDDRQRLWLGTLNGLFAFNTLTHKFTNYSLSFPEGKLSARLINSIITTPDGLWAGANGGGLFFIPNEGKPRHYSYEKGKEGVLSDNFVNTLLADDQQGMWVGTQNGLDYFDYRQNKVTRTYRKNADTPLLSNDIQTLYYDSKKRLWVGTEGGGLYYFDTASATFYPLNATLGLTDNAIHTLLEDPNGNLWVSTDNGLFMIAFKTFKPPFKRADLQVSHYTSQHGLSGNMYMANAGYASSDGTLFFGGMNGLTYFSPDRLYRNRKAPKVVLTDFMIPNQSVPISADNGKASLQQLVPASRRIVLRHDENYISIKYAGINYVNPENNRYAYRLEGLPNDVGWHDVGKERIANYTNLDPGEYVFKVKAANNDGIWSEETTILRIKVLSPLWKTWWAYTLYAIVGLSIFVSVLRFIRGKELLKRDLLHEHQKLEFFTYISHEIRTPLTLMLAPLDRMVKQYGDDGAMAKYLHLMDNNAKRLKKLINELLDFRKIEYGKMKLYYTAVNPTSLLHETYLPFVGLAEQKKVRFQLMQEDCPDILYVDKDQLDKVFANLLGNAFKFVPIGGEVQVKIRRDLYHGKSMLAVYIGDSGPGIPEGEKKHLFHLFWQASNENQFNRGTGIGLALAKKIVELHGGFITYTRKDGFSWFAVFLPEQLLPLEAENVLPDYILKEIGLPEGEDNGRLPVGSNMPEDHLREKKKRRILVVDDHADMRVFLQDTLQGSYEVVVAEDGEDAWQLAVREMPDLIISDVMMPKVNGLAFCEQIKKDEQTNHIPVVLLTAKTADIHKLEGLTVGADLYITKPFSLDMLLLQVHNLLETKDSLRRKYSQQLVLKPLDIVANTQEEHFLQKLLLLIEEHLEDASFGVPELAEAIGMSKSVLYNKVQAITNLSIANFIKSVRLHKAASYLSEGKCSIAEVAFAVGFNDRKYFSKEFRKVFNCAPSAYLESQLAPLSEKPKV